MVEEAGITVCQTWAPVTGVILYCLIFIKFSSCQKVTNCVSEKGKDDLALNTFTTNCDSDTEIYLLQCSRKLCFVEVWNNYRDVVGGFFCHLQMVKGGVSETRIEKRIVITGDADIDHDEVSMQT